MPIIHLSFRWVSPTDIDRRTCAIIIPAWDSIWRYLGFTSDQNNCDWCIVYCSLSLKTQHGWERSWMLSACVVGKNLNAFNWISMAEETYTEQYRIMGISLLYLWYDHTTTEVKNIWNYSLVVLPEGVPPFSFCSHITICFCVQTPAKSC